MASDNGQRPDETVGLPVVGQEGDTCEQCGSVLATDQRYCLNCGWRRGESRVDYETAAERRRAPAGERRRVSQRGARNPQWTPAFAIRAIALLGVMLLLGVLIGKKDNNNTQTVAAQARADDHRRGDADHRHHRDHAEQATRPAKGGGAQRARRGQRRPGRQRAPRAASRRRTRAPRSSRTRRVVRTWSPPRASRQRSIPTVRPAAAAPRPASGADHGPAEETEQVEEARASWRRSGSPGRPPRAIAKPSGVGPKGQGRQAQGRDGEARARTGRPRSDTPVGQPELLKQREELSRRFAELQWDLGGMAYEMASRDHYRLDVLNKQAAKLQEVDASSARSSGCLKLGTAGAAGTCPACGALQARGAVFCWQCGNELRPAAHSSERLQAEGQPQT